MMKVLGVGLSRTGTLSLAKALDALGFRTLHWAPERLSDIILGRTDRPDFRRYDDVDAVADLPAALFYRELLEAYPDAKCILTTRPEADWLRSMKRHCEVSVPEHLAGKPDKVEEVYRTHEFAYGSRHVAPYLYLKRFREHHRNVLRDIPPERLLVLDLKRDDGWQPLCDFLGVPVPDAEFPHVNRSAARGAADAGRTNRVARLGRRVLGLVPGPWSPRR